MVAFLTREHGKRRGVARGAKRKLQPLRRPAPAARQGAHRLVREGRPRPRPDLGRVELLRPAKRLQSDLEGLLLGAYLGEHGLDVRAGERGRRAPSTGCSTPRSTRSRRAASGVAARYFETWVLRLAGVFPPPTDCPLCGAALAAEAPALVGARRGAALPSLRRRRPGRARRVARRRSRSGCRSARESLARAAARPPPPRDARPRWRRSRGRVRRAFLGHELRSYHVMRRTLGDASAAPDDDSTRPCTRSRS